jgi:hypothetical protein
VAEGDVETGERSRKHQGLGALQNQHKPSQFGDLSALLGSSHPDLSGIEGAIAERLKAGSSSTAVTTSAASMMAQQHASLLQAGALAGLTAEELTGLMTGVTTKQSSQLDSASAGILNSLSSLSSLVGADPASMLGLAGLRGFSTTSSSGAVSAGKGSSSSRVSDEHRL